MKVVIPPEQLPALESTLEYLVLGHMPIVEFHACLL